MRTAIPIKKPVYYPDSDGRPMAESDLHRDEMVREINALQRHFSGQKVYVSGNLLVYYVDGDPKKCFSPDVLVAKGLVQRRRRVYKIWEERVVPQVVIEVSSKKTKKQDLHDKPALYNRLGIREYFLFDPTEDYLTPTLQGFQLDGDHYVRIEAESDGSLISHELDLRLIAEGDELGFYRLDTGARLLTSEEAREISEEARIEADEARLEAETARIAAETAQKSLQQSLQAERLARANAEAELARLREALRNAQMQ